MEDIDIMGQPASNDYSKGSEEGTTDTSNDKAIVASTEAAAPVAEAIVTEAAAPVTTAADAPAPATTPVE